MGSVVIHCEPAIGWQGPFAQRLRDGLKRLGITHSVNSERQRTSDDLAILLGTSCWRAVESTGQYLLVDRCSYGDTNNWVSLVLNGHGRRGDHRVPHGAPGYRWSRCAVPVKPWRWMDYPRRVLCGQTETYSPHYGQLTDWYRTVKATHFRSHPAGDNPTGLPELRSWEDVGQVVTLNSSVAVDAVLNGIPTVSMDEGSMAWEVTSHTEEVMKPDRRPWLNWLAWTQWSHDEISEGKWAHLLSPHL